MSKIYVLDTNVLLHDPKSLFAFEDNEVVIPLVVLDELDKKKDRGHEEIARHARMVIRSLDDMRDVGNLHEGVKTASGGLVRVELNHKDSIPEQLDPTRADNRIISVMLGLTSEQPDRTVTLVTKDINLRVKCDALNVPAEDYHSDSVAESAEFIYSGVTEDDISNRELDKFYKDGVWQPHDGIKLYKNQYILFNPNLNSKHSRLARFDGQQCVKINAPESVWGISPRNKEQACALDALFNPDIKLVTLIGRAGTGKTLLAVAAGISQIFDNYVYRKIIMSRPVVPMGKDIGYLPGDKDEKMRPWMAPLQDNLELLFSEKGANYLEMERDAGKIEIGVLSYIRGRSIPRTFIIIDECLTEGHLVSMADGSLKDVSNIVVGDVVVSTNISDNKVSTGIVDGVIERDTDEIYDIKTSVSTMSCTSNHPMYVYNDGFHKKQASDICVGDFIPVPRSVPHVKTIDLDGRIAYFLGMILSDGHITKDYKTIKVAVRKDIGHFENRFRDGIMAIVKQDISRDFVNKRGDYTICLNKKSLVQKICSDYGILSGNKAWKIRVPRVIFNLDIESVKLFVSALFDAEGDINITNSGSLVINYTTASLYMAKEVQHLLKKFNIVARRMDYVHKDSGSDMHRVYITGSDAYAFYSNVGFLMDRKQRILSAHFRDNVPLDKARLPLAGLLRDRLRGAGVKWRDSLLSSIQSSKTIYRYMLNARYSEFFSKEEMEFFNSHNFYEVKSISSRNAKCKVYDFRVPQLGTFCADGMLSSNCQNLTRHEVKTIITRSGEGSKVVLTGDINQIDNPYIDAVDNGLSFAIEQFKDEAIASHITLKKGERSELANKAAELL